MKLNLLLTKQQQLRTQCYPFKYLIHPIRPIHFRRFNTRKNLNTISNCICAWIHHCWQLCSLFDLQPHSCVWGSVLGQLDACTRLHKYSPLFIDGSSCCRCIVRQAPPAPGRKWSEVLFVMVVSWWGRRLSGSFSYFIVGVQCHCLCDLFAWRACVLGVQASRTDVWHSAGAPSLVPKE